MLRSTQEDSVFWLLPIPALQFEWANHRISHLQKNQSFLQMLPNDQQGETGAVADEKEPSCFLFDPSFQRNDFLKKLDLSIDCAIAEQKNIRFSHNKVRFPLPLSALPSSPTTGSSLAPAEGVYRELTFQITPIKENQILITLHFPDAEWKGRGIQLLEQAEEISGLGIWELDLNTNELYWSDGVFRICGYEPGAFEVNFQSGLNVIHPDDQPTALQAMKNTLENGIPYKIPKRFVHKDGSIRHIISMGKLIRNESGTPLRLTGVFQDVTDQVLLREQANKLSAQFKALVQSIDGIFWEADPHTFAMFYVSPQAEKILGYTPEEWVASPTFWQDHIHPEDRSRAVGFCHNETVAGRNHSFEYRMQNKQGEYVYLRDIVAVEMDENGAIKAMRGFMMDITDQHKALQELQLSQQQLKLSNAELEQFAYIASHDLQEPLRMISSFLQQLEKKYNYLLDDKGKQYIHFAVDGAKRMKQIILDLLEYSRAGNLPIQREYINIVELLEEIQLLFSRKIQEKNAEIIIGDMPSILFFKTPLRQVLQNLIGNALKYVRPGVPPVLSVTCELKNNEYLFAVADNGIGLEPGTEEKIFKIFQRLHLQEQFDGTGMGLTIAKKITEHWGGKIWVESTSGKGSTFFFTIPIAT